MGGFTAGCGTGVQKTRTRGQALQKQGRCNLRGGVLHGHPPLREVRQVAYRHGAGQVNRRTCAGLGLDTRLRQLLQVMGYAAVTQVDAQGHGCAVIGGAQQRLPMVRVLGLQERNPPIGVVPLGLQLAIGRFHQGIALAQEAAQAGIDKAGVRPP